MEQNYQYDLVDNAKLLDRYIGQTISVTQVHGDKTELVSGKLLSASGGLILQRESGEVLTLGSYSNIQFPALPGGLISKPTLVWKVNSKSGGTQDTRVSYQTQGVTWWSDYNVTMREQGGNCNMDLAAWVTLVNQSGGSWFWWNGGGWTVLDPGSTVEAGAALRRSPPASRRGGATAR